jgi:hypothetical protein
VVNYCLLSKGAGPVGNASRNISVLAAGKGGCIVNLLELVQQLHHWIDYPPLVQNTGYGAYVLFAVFCLLSLVWTYFCVPETAHRTLEQMDHVFKDNTSEREEERRQEIESEIVVRRGSSIGGAPRV